MFKSISQMFIDIARTLAPKLSMEEQRDRLIMQMLKGSLPLTDFIVQYKQLMENYGIDLPNGVLEHAEPYMSRLVHMKSVSVD